MIVTERQKSLCCVSSLFAHLPCLSAGSWVTSAHWEESPWRIFKPVYPGLLNPWKHPEFYSVKPLEPPFYRVTFPTLCTSVPQELASDTFSGPFTMDLNMTSRAVIHLLQIGMPHFCLDHIHIYVYRIAHI